MSEYRSVRAPSYDVDGLVAKLNEAAAEGWDVVTVVPSSSDLVAILRKVEAPAEAAPAAEVKDEPAEVDKKVEASAVVAEDADKKVDEADTLVEETLEDKKVDAGDVAATAAAAVTAEKAAEAAKPEPAGWGSAPASSAPVPSSPSTSPTPVAATPASPSPTAAAAPAAAAPGAAAPAAATPAAAGAKPATPAGWYPDPSGRYELRYWNGSDWSEHVARGGQQFTDPPVA